MIGRVWTAFRVELDKAIRAKSTYLGPVLLIVAVGAAAAHKLQAGDSLDYSFIAYATGAALGAPALLMVLIFCSALVASEFHSGTIRLVLVRPVRRREFLMAKMLAGMAYGLVLVTLVGGGSWLAAWLSGTIDGVTFGGETIYTDVEMQRAYVLGVLFSFAPFAAAVAYGTMLSSLTRNPSVAVGAAVGTWVLLDLFKYPLHIEKGLFWTFWGTPWQLFQNQCDGLRAEWPYEATTGLITCGVTIAVCSTVAMFALRQRNL
jgi:ABC-type transport system involved in multi-copper enzyme maturation permease subunit